MNHTEHGNIAVGASNSLARVRSNEEYLANNLNAITYYKPNKLKVNGPLAEKLMSSFDFELTPFAYAVWEITGDVRLDDSPAALLRANQNTLQGAIGYMEEGRVIVFNHSVASDDLKTGQL